MKNLAIFCGGVSAEHEVSIRSARNIIKAIDKQEFNPILVIISRAGTWYLQNDLAVLDQIAECAEPFQHGELCTMIRKATETCIITTKGRELMIDAAFPVLHGPMGEDGTLQGLFEVMNLAYVGSGVLASALGMDKDFMKKVWAKANVPVVPSACLSNKQDYVNYATVSETLGSTVVFVKPCVMGSSVGVSKVSSPETYDAAVKEAFKYSSKVLVEKFIPCREIECSVLGNKQPKASCLGEIKPNHEFYSYEAKYIDPNGADLIIPAKLDAKTTEKIRDIAVKAFTALECSGLARVDFFLSSDNEVFVNELNTIPGFTSISMYPKLWEASGIGYSDLIKQLIDLAFELQQEKQQICLTPNI